MQVERIQYPIGQGCFHAGRIQWRDGESGAARDFRYVYDCGSTNLPELEREIKAYRTPPFWVDALFVSHLDSDHVNGLDRLLGGVRVDTVYIPYVDPDKSILDLVEDDLGGGVSASLIEAKIDPGSWFGSRGVSEVVLVLASENDGPLDGEQTIDDAGGDRDFTGGSESIRKSDSEPSGRLGGRATESEKRSGDPALISNHGEAFKWVLVPHVAPAPIERRRQFVNNIRSVLGLEEGQGISANRLADALRDSAERKRLRECYEKIIHRGSRGCHNRVSMSLYSGPASGKCGPLCLGIIRSRHSCRTAFATLPPCRVGHALKRRLDG